MAILRIYNLHVSNNSDNKYNNNIFIDKMMYESNSRRCKRTCAILDKGKRLTKYKMRDEINKL